MLNVIYYDQAKRMAKILAKCNYACKILQTGFQYLLDQHLLELANEVTRYEIEVIKTYTEILQEYVQRIMMLVPICCHYCEHRLESKPDGILQFCEIFSDEEVFCELSGCYCLYFVKKEKGGGGNGEEVCNSE